jgi:hypothetical protein
MAALTVGSEVVCSDDLGEVDEHLLVVQSHALVAALQSEHSMLRYTRQADHRAVLLLLLLPLSLYHSPTPPINTAKKTLSDAVLLSTVEKRGQTRGNDIAVCILS